MAVKLGRMTFRFIKGRLVPIRIGAEKATMAAIEAGRGISKSAYKKAKALLETREFKVSRAGNLLKYPESDSTAAMNKFIEKTGAVRFSRHDDSTMIHVAKKLSEEQKMVLATHSKGEIFVDINNPIEKHLNFGRFENFADAYRKILRLGPKEAKKVDTKLAEKALKEFRTTGNPDEAGYILRSGEMLDFSGKRQGGTRGVRYMDHREVNAIMRSRATKPTAADIQKILKRKQLERKSMEAQKHRATTLKRDIESIGNDPDLQDVKKDFERQLKRLIEIKRNKRMKK